jgi:hypothetical protein
LSGTLSIAQCLHNGAESAAQVVYPNDDQAAIKQQLWWALDVLFGRQDVAWRGGGRFAQGRRFRGMT